MLRLSVYYIQIEEVCGMNGIRVVVLMAFVAAFIAGAAFAVEHEASMEKGKALFSDPALGTNGKTCDTCHHDGKGLEKADTKKNLDEIISACIKASLKGQALDPKSVEVQSLALYVKSLSEKKPAATKKPAVGC